MITAPGIVCTLFLDRFVSQKSAGHVAEQQLLRITGARGLKAEVEYACVPAYGMYASLRNAVHASRQQECTAMKTCNRMGMGNVRVIGQLSALPKTKWIIIFNPYPSRMLWVWSWVWSWV
jgi:hypothetical protein